MVTTTDENGVVRPYGWTLVAIVGVDKTEAIQCECRKCGRRVFAKIHFIEWPDGSLECWGSGCFRKELGGPAGQPSQAALFPEIAGRRMTSDERAMLLGNRVALKAWFQAQREEAERKRRAEEEEKVRAKQADHEAFLKSLANLPPVAPYHRPVSAFRASPASRPSVYAVARVNIMRQWADEGADHTLPGLVGMFNKEVQAEMERLQQLGE